MAKKIIPLGNRILVQRRKVGERLGKSGLIIAPDQVKDASTDLADVIYVPELTFTDKHLIDNAESITASLADKSKQGNSDALVSLLRFNDFLKIKSIKSGDAVMISKYVGTDFTTSDASETLTIVNADDVIGVIAQE